MKGRRRVGFEILVEGASGLEALGDLLFDFFYAGSGDEAYSGDVASHGELLWVEDPQIFP